MFDITLIDLTDLREPDYGEPLNLETEAFMPNVEDVYASNSNSLKAEDLRGHEIKVSIIGSEVKDFDNGKKIVLSFKGKDKTLVLNKTNARKIADANGWNTDDWVGKEVVLYPDKTEFNGKMVDCIRLRLPAKELGEDDIPF